MKCTLRQSGHLYRAASSGLLAIAKAFGHMLRFAAFFSHQLHRAVGTSSSAFGETPVAAQHTTFAYLWRWLGVKQVADLEPLLGVARSPGHLQEVLGLVRAEPPRADVVSAYQDARAARWLAQQLDGRAVVLQLPSTVTDEHSTSTLAGPFDHLLERLLEARK